MLIGISGLVNGDWRAIDANVLRNVRGMGFAVLQVRVDDPRDLDPASAGALRLLFEEHHVVIGQTVGNYGGGLVADDSQERTAAIEFMKRMCGVTASLARRIRTSGPEASIAAARGFRTPGTDHRWCSTG